MSTKRRGRPILGVIAGIFLGLFVGIDLLVLGVVPLDSAVLTITPLVGLALGLVLSLVAPFRRGDNATPAPVPENGAATEADAVTS